MVVQKIHSKALSVYTALLLDFNRFSNGIIMLHGMNTLYTAKSDLLGVVQTWHVNITGFPG